MPLLDVCVRVRETGNERENEREREREREKERESLRACGCGCVCGRRCLCCGAIQVTKYVSNDTVYAALSY
jgi:hypothetical protein